MEGWRQAKTHVSRHRRLSNYGRHFSLCHNKRWSILYNWLLTVGKKLSLGLLGIIQLCCPYSYCIILHRHRLDNYLRTSNNLDLWERNSPRKAHGLLCRSICGSVPEYSYLHISRVSRLGLNLFDWSPVWLAYWLPHAFVFSRSFVGINKKVRGFAWQHSMQ